MTYGLKQASEKSDILCLNRYSEEIYYYGIIVSTKTTIALGRREIISKDGTKYFYTTSKYHAENVLGVIKAKLKQFTIYKTDSDENVVCNLYQTNEGNWYDLSYNNGINSFLQTSIKIAIDDLKQVSPC